MKWKLKTKSTKMVETVMTGFNVNTTTLAYYKISSLVILNYFLRKSLLHHDFVILL